MNTKTHERRLSEASYPQSWHESLWVSNSQGEKASREYAGQATQETYPEKMTHESLLQTGELNKGCFMFGIITLETDVPEAEFF